MIIIDAEKFLSYLIFSKHIDGLTCGEVKEAIEMCKVDDVLEDEINDVLNEIKAEIYAKRRLIYMTTDCDLPQKVKIVSLDDAYTIIDNHRKRDKE